MRINLPLSFEIPFEDPSILFHFFADQPWSFLLDSADSYRPLDDTNRFSYIAFDPFEKIIIKDKKEIHSNVLIDNPFNYLKNVMSKFQLDYKTDLPLFQGGAVGYFSYDLCHYLEKINFPSQQEKTVYADLAVGIYDLIIAFDHHLKKAWVISTGFPEKIVDLQLKKAKQRIAYCLERISKKNRYTTSMERLPETMQFLSSFNNDNYSELVKKAQSYIRQGDIFEVNLSHRFKAELTLPPKDRYPLYLKMRACNPSPFSAYLNLGDHQLLSTSPERFLLLKNKIVSTRPIKGTIRRGMTEEEDHQLAAALLASEKEHSENIMIVDLLRNDLSKVCTPNSILVKKLCGLESYPTVHHLVSIIEGKLQSDITAFDLLEACFPGGSITGAPKVRAMQIIYELEPTQRGPYCGSIGFIGFNESMDTSIIIRTILLEDNKMTYQTGGAIVLDSSPEKEYEETLTKSIAIKHALEFKDTV